ncbi:hypothetical protein CALCODRAFT_372467 [Calocera cornea HHB12733]|uniref:CoA-dependent acyltransferase n=1 Tax=Calocera cornea HHB12733 TaxID=1353952 RepID=A0A165EGV4_9BASI|nr:hypothetical protein CALCODRAFT_372467 [Calocera cornea HHB12733]
MSSPWSWQQGPPAFMVSAGLPDEVTARTWNRPFWGGELAFAIGNVANPGFSDMLLSCHINIPSTTSLVIDYVRRATRALRWSHPGIAATIAFPPFTSLADFKPEQGRLVYQTAASEKDVSDWLDEVVFDKSFYLSAAEGDLNRALDALKKEIGAITTPRTQWMLKVNFISDAESNKHAVLIQTGHVIFDGIGTFEVLDLWLHELARVLTQEKEGCQWGEEAARLAKAVPDRLPEPWSAQPTPADHPVMKEIYASLQMPPVQFGLPVMHPDAVPTYTGTILKTFAAPLAENLRLAARTNGCGVFSAIVAANYLSILSLNPPTTFDGELHARILPNASDLRAKYLAGGAASKKDRRTWQVASALGGGVISARRLERFLQSDGVVRPGDVWTLARELQAQVTAQAPYQATAAYWVPDAIAMMMASFFSAAPAAIPKDKVVNVSSMGLMDDSLSASYPANSARPVLTISHPVFSGIGPALPSNELGALVHPYTWQRTLFLSFSFPAAALGSVEEQRARDAEGEPTLYGYVERFSGLLRELADTSALPN